MIDINSYCFALLTLFIGSKYICFFLIQSMRALIIMLRNKLIKLHENMCITSVRNALLNKIIIRVKLFLDFQDIFEDGTMIHLIA